ncbi:MAG: SDR family NAD(P)-dependent oxidoreductase, partial [Pseudomonadota bacterium]|nr:SDR family NAD(P)-dependent oxidoreductase [Pseudomonadota bacterium]
MTSRVALVTGGTGGIGTAIIKKLADMGHKVATNYRSEEKAKAWADKMKADGYDILLVKGDVTSADEAAAMVKQVEDQLGPVEILVNNAGITRDGTFHKMKSEQWTDVINTNLNS